MRPWRAAQPPYRLAQGAPRRRPGLAAAKVPAEIEVYEGAAHGWCVPDMPSQNGKPIYSKPDAERAWGKLMELYKAALA